MTTPDTSSYFGSADIEERPKLPWIKFADIGDAASLTITNKGMAPDYVFNKNKDAPKVQKTWPNGDLKEFLVVTGTLDQPARVGDGTVAGSTVPAGSEVNLAVKGKFMTQAIGVALRDKGKTDLAPGDKLWVKFTGWEAATLGEAKTYDARYAPGTPPAADTSDVFASSAAKSVVGSTAGKDDEPPFHNGFMTNRPSGKFEMPV